MTEDKESFPQNSFSKLGFVVDIDPDDDADLPDVDSCGQGGRSLNYQPITKTMSSREKDVRKKVSRILDSMRYSTKLAIVRAEKLDDEYVYVLACLQKYRKGFTGTSKILGMKVSKVRRLHSTMDKLFTKYAYSQAENTVQD